MDLPSQELVVSPVLRTADGTETAIPPVAVKPEEVASIDIGASVPQLVGKYGSVVLRYRSGASRSLYAAIMIHDLGHPIALHLDAVAEAQDYDPVSREGIWWLPNETAADYLVLTNQGKSSVAFDLSIYDAAGKKSKQIMMIGPRQTSRYSVRQLVRSVGLGGVYGGIKISAHAHAGSLDSVHFVFDEQAGFSALLKMFDYEPRARIAERDYAGTGSWTLRAPMMALSQPDPALEFPSDIVLQPKIFFRNVTSRPVIADLRFNWRSQNATGKAVGPTVRLAPFETSLIDVSALQDGRTLPQEANWTSVVLTTKGLPDEIMAVAASYDQTLRYGAQTPFSDRLSFAWKGGRWEYDTQHDSIITGGNGATKPIPVALTLFYNGGKEKYELQQTLQPDEQLWIDVGKLIRERVPDKNGKTLPLGLDSGSYEVRDLTAAGIGRVFEGKVIYDKTYGHAAYGCGGQCCYNTPYLTNNPLGIPFQGTAGNGVNTSDNCGGPPVNVSSTFWGNWKTASQSIATVNTTGTHTGMAAGSTTSSTSGQIQQTYGRYQCTVQTRTPSGGDHVQIPSSLKVLSISTLPTGTSGDYGCLTGSDYGIKLDIKYQVLDQNTPAQPLKDATMVPHEHVVYPATGQTVDTDICPSRISVYAYDRCQRHLPRRAIWRMLSRQFFAWPHSDD